MSLPSKTPMTTPVRIKLLGANISDISAASPAGLLRAAPPPALLRRRNNHPVLNRKGPTCIPAP
ncbi:hypothetical protein SAMN06265370_106117 [Puniceibacterium sediminis]|uniref:Uncharacterized protein n=1 Tax=Puniceibacterium sediminis TaxID=1608407 RepID=A0A238WNL1_9RHOB|nr:hypothetical protein SAMN06265370_106117 [Puniceibacterium sediminis]